MTFLAITKKNQQYRFVIEIYLPSRRYTIAAALDINVPWHSGGPLTVLLTTLLSGTYRRDVGRCWRFFDWQGHRQNGQSLCEGHGRRRHHGGNHRRRSDKRRWNRWRKERRHN